MPKWRWHRHLNHQEDVGDLRAVVGEAMRAFGVEAQRVTGVEFGVAALPLDGQVSGSEDDDLLTLERTPVPNWFATRVRRSSSSEPDT